MDLTPPPTELEISRRKFAARAARDRQADRAFEEARAYLADRLGPRPPAVVVGPPPHAPARVRYAIRKDPAFTPFPWWDGEGFTASLAYARTYDDVDAATREIAAVRGRIYQVAVVEFPG